MAHSSRFLLPTCAGLALALSACNCGGDVTIGGCTTTTCASGCCDAMGTCRQASAQTCGSNASACVACNLDQVCTLGVCNGGSGGGTGTGGGNATGGGGDTGGGGGGDPLPPYDGGCGPIDAGNPPLPRKCAPATANECAGPTDTFLAGAGVATSLHNNAQGNGFDDDCDGQVDEGCSCPNNGVTKDCYVVPATQADGTGKPVGWCTTNAKGSLDCAGGEIAVWSGVCRGGQRPNPHDTCGPGDFNCDGLQGNSDYMGCSCPTSVVCPSATVTQAPYPPEANIPLIDGSAWITDVGQRANASNWTWTVVGGDCDNVLPFPTFALYDQANSAGSNARKGARTPVKFDMGLSRYVATAGEPVIAIQAANYGSGVAGGKVYPAFALSGDYLVQGEFDLNGKHYSCTQKVAVLAPGIRAELCWDTVGGDGSTDGNDIDLHFARLQGVSSCANQGWEDTCTISSALQDCYYSSNSGCRDDSTSAPGWGYADSASTACLGWGSKRSTGTQGCTNPRLDLDNVSCDNTVDDPNNATSFCGPENINLDNPKDNDAFVVGVTHFGNNSGTSNARPHVNLYCNGSRVLSIGYNPATGQTGYPLLTKPGGFTRTGDLWVAATIKAHVAGNQLTGCDVASIPSHHADPTRDGPASVAGAGNNICVDSTANLTPAPNHFNYTSHKFVDASSAQGLAAGTQPSTAAQWCKH